MMEHRRIWISISVITFTTIAAYCWWRKNKKEKIPEKWNPVGKVSELHLYPLKSGHRIEISEGFCSKYGLEQITDRAVYKLKDRIFIVYNEPSLEFRTARTHPKLVLIKVSNHDLQHVALDAPDMKPHYMKMPDTENAKIFKITMHHNEPIEIIDCGDEVASWVSQYVLNKNSGLRIGFHDEKLKKRVTDPKLYKFYPNLSDNDMGLFSDLSSYMLMNKTSMTDMNSKLEKEVSFCQFRPNILVEDVDLPYVEDNWQWIKIGNNAIFRNVKPCTRCVFISIDAETGVMDSKREPLRTLKKYRQLSDEEERKANSNSPVMGVNLGLRKPGVIKVNDIVYVA